MLNNINSNTPIQTGLTNQAGQAQNMSLAQSYGSNQPGPLLLDRLGNQGAQVLALLQQIINLLSNNATPTPPQGRQIIGTNGNDTLQGTAGNDSILGNAGDDRIFGGAGADVIVGGAGSDFLDGGSSHDELTGGAGNDILLGGQGPDTLFGEDGNDLAFGGTGDDQLDGGRGTDFLLGGAGNDTLRGSQGDDVLHGGAGADTFDLSEMVPAGQQPSSFFNNGVDFITDFQSGVDKIDVGLYTQANPIAIPQAEASNVTYNPNSGQLWVNTIDGPLAVSKLIAQLPPGTQISQSDILNGNLTINRG